MRPERYVDAQAVGNSHTFMPSQSPTVDHGRRNLRGAGAALAQRVAAFRAARRHTIMVRILRVLFPLLAISGLGFYAVILQSQFKLGSGTLKPGQVQITADDLKMKNPTYFGVTKDDGKYVVKAREAAVDLSMTGPIKLDGIDGELVQASGVKTVLKAGRGTLERDKGEMVLFEGVQVDTSSGMKARLKTATVYNKEHRVVSNDALTAEMPTGSLTARTMDLWTEKKRGTFTGDVALRLVQTPTSNGTRPQIGLGGDPKQPIDIKSQRFDIDDMALTAAFTGGVIALQGDTQLRSSQLHVTYESKTGVNMSTPASTGGLPKVVMPGADTSGTELTKLSAREAVVMTSTDRRVIADSADFDVKADSALLQGNVEVTQGRNVLRGGRLAVDRKHGRSRLDNPANGDRPAGRIATTFYQGADIRPAGVKPKPDAETIGGGFGAFRSDPNAPMDIDADTLDVNDTIKTAVFRGAVNARQGEFHVQTSELNVFYSGQTGLMQRVATDESLTKGVGAQISKIETRGGTSIRSKDGQEAIGDNALFDMKANTVVMSGKAGVTLQQGPNITHGTRLKIDLKSGEARIETDRSGPHVNASPPTAAQQSISAKAGIAPPPQPDGNACRSSTGQPCAVLYPEQLKNANEQRTKTGSEGQVKSDASKRTTTQGWQPSTSPSPVYRGN